MRVLVWSGVVYSAGEGACWYDGCAHDTTIREPILRWPDKECDERSRVRDRDGIVVAPHVVS